MRIGIIPFLGCVQLPFSMLLDERESGTLTYQLSQRDTTLKVSPTMMSPSLPSASLTLKPS